MGELVTLKKREKFFEQLIPNVAKLLKCSPMPRSARPSRAAFQLLKTKLTQKQAATESSSS